MAETIALPQLGFDMREGTLINWVKQVGDTIKSGDVLAEIEADKATIEIPSPADGVLLTTLVNAGDVVAVGAPIATIGAAGEGAGAKAAPAAAKAVAAVSVPAESAATIAPIAAPTNGTSTPPAQNGDLSDLPDGLRASPIARRIAEERGIDLHQVAGTGPNGRINKADVESFVPSSIAPAPVAATPITSSASRASMPAPSGPGIEEIPVSKLRARIATRMVESKTTVPHFYVTTEIDMAAALALRKQINEGLDEAHKVSVNDLVIKATALTLRNFPNLNSHYYGDKIIRYTQINIGIAVALDGGGLMNVVAKDADRTAISVLAARNKEMIASARVGKVKPADVEGSTFTVSNLGAYEVEHFIAIINPPEAGILAIGSAQQVPVVINGEVKIGTRMKVTISVDHRVSDGAEGAQFLQAFKKLLENPMRLLI